MRFLYEWHNRQPKNYLFFWTAHLRELLVQSEESIRSVFGPHVNIVWWDAKSKPDISKLKGNTFVLTQIQSTRTFKNTSKFDNLLIVDETHREAAKTYTDFEKEVNPIWKMGLTATPYRLDKQDLRYDVVAAQETLLGLASQGWLAVPKYIKVSTNRNYELHIQGDFTKKALEELGSDLCRADLVAAHYIKNQKLYGKTVIFAPSVKSALDIADKLRLKGVKAAALSGKDDKVYRNAVVQDFKDSKIQVLANVQLFTEGFDCPDIRTVMLARPTISKSLWLQAVGRGARISPPLVAPANDYFYVVDFVDNIKMYPLVAQAFAVELLNAPKSKAQLKQEQEAEQEKQLKKKAKSKEEKEMITKLAKKGQVLDMIGYMTITNLFKSGKVGKRIAQSYPVFKQELPYFKSMLAHTKARMDSREPIFPFIQSSYERGGNKTNLSKSSWTDLAWAVFHHLRALHYGVKHPWPVIETTYYFPPPQEPADLSLIEVTEPFANKQDAIRLRTNSCSIRYGKISFAGMSYHTVFVTVDNPKGFFWRGTLKQLEKDLTLALGTEITVKRVMGTTS